MLKYFYSPRSNLWHLRVQFAVVSGVDSATVLEYCLNFKFLIRRPFQRLSPNEALSVFIWKNI